MIDFEEVASAPYPGTLTYVVPRATPIFMLAWWVEPWVDDEHYATVTWTVSCWPSTTVEATGCASQMSIPTGSTGGSFVTDAQAYWKPGSLVTPAVTIPAGRTAWVLGQDESGQYYKIIWACDYLRVLKSTVGPNNDTVWHGAALPAKVVR